MKTEILVVSPWQENTYVLYDETKEAVIIDCGCYTEEEEQNLIKLLEHLELKVVKLLHTHLHIDHVLGYQFLNKQFGLLTHAHKDDEFLLAETETYAKMLGLGDVKPPPESVGTYLKDGDTVSFGNTKLEILHIPGHTPGHICILNPQTKELFSGDCLFRESIGRTDLPYGDYEQLITSIKTKLLTLEDDIKVYPGHGPHTTIGYEKNHNMFLK